MNGFENYSCNLRLEHEKKLDLKVIFASDRPGHDECIPLANYVLHTSVVGHDLITRLTLMFADTVTYDTVEKIVEDDYLHDCIDHIYIEKDADAASALDLMDMEFVSLTETYLPFGNAKSLAMELVHVTKKGDTESK